MSISQKGNYNPLINRGLEAGVNAGTFGAGGVVGEVAKRFGLGGKITEFAEKKIGASDACRYARFCQKFGRDVQDRRWKWRRFHGQERN